MQIRDASESLLKRLLGGKSLAEMTSSCSLETQTEYFCGVWAKVVEFDLVTSKPLLQS